MNRVFSEDGPAELYDAEAERNSMYCDRCGGYHSGVCPQDEEKPAAKPDPRDADVEAALKAFWMAITQRFTGVRAGDLSPDMTIRLECAAYDAVKEWVENNVPALYDYKHQAWTKAGVYEACGHAIKSRGCYACAHAGEPVTADADLH